MFTPEEYNATVQAFSQPINPLAEGSEQYSQLLKTVLTKMQKLVIKPEAPFDRPPVDIEVEAETPITKD